MKKRLLGILLSLAVAASLLSGCGSSDNTGSTGADNSAAQLESTEGGENMAAADNEAAAQAIADRKAEAEKTGQYEKVVFAFYNWTGRPAGTDRIQEKINERIRETLGLEVELLVLDSASYAQNVRLMLSSGEQIDIFNSCPLGYTALSLIHI